MDFVQFKVNVLIKFFNFKSSMTVFRQDHCYGLVWFAMVWEGLVWFGFVGMGGGQMTSELIHAEISVMDWHGWLAWMKTLTLQKLNFLNPAF